MYILYLSLFDYDELCAVDLLGDWKIESYSSLINVNSLCF